MCLNCFLNASWQAINVFQEVTVHINIKFGNIILTVDKIFLTPIYTGNFCHSNSMQLLSHQRCNFKIAHVNQVWFSLWFVAVISRGSWTCLMLQLKPNKNCIRVAATKINYVNCRLSIFTAQPTWKKYSPIKIIAFNIFLFFLFSAWNGHHYGLLVKVALSTYY